MPKKPIRVTAIYNQEPVIKLYVLALLALARQLDADNERDRNLRLTEARRSATEGQAGD